MNPLTSRLLYDKLYKEVHTAEMPLHNPEKERTMVKGIAQKLLHGSKEIDRMKQEIIQVVMMTLGFVSPKKEGTVKVPSGTSPCQWTLEFRTRETGSDYYGYDIDVFCHSKESGAKLFGKRTELPMMNMPAKDVLAVHESLDAFVSGVVELFPEIGKELQVFLHTDDK
jgi:hypothetical protein